MKQMERRSIELTPEQWLVLEQLAIDTNSTAPTGPNSGRPSWRTLIKRIANGEIIVTARGDKNAKPQA